MLLGESEEKLYQINGKPLFRDYKIPERLSYKSIDFEGSFIIYKGKIIQIRYIIHKNNIESIKWFTALNLHQTQLDNMSIQEQMNLIIKKYDNPPHIKLKNKLIIYSRGIRFVFNENRIKYIDIFNSRRKY